MTITLCACSFCIGLLLGTILMRGMYLPRIRQLKPDCNNLRRKCDEFRAGKAWYRETPYQDVSDEI